MDSRNETKALVKALPDDELHGLLQSVAGTLTGPQRDFARWYVRHEGARIPDQLVELKELTGYEWSNDERKELFGSGAFRTYYLAIREKSKRTLAIRIEEVALKGVEALDWALDKAQHESDYRAIPNIVNPVLERAMPRRQDMSNAAPTVHIHISDKQAALMDSPAPIVEAEIISVEILGESTD